MADINVSNLEVDDRPISLRRKRRSSAAESSRSTSNSRTATAPRPHGISTPPATPKRAKKRVRFSDPGSSLQTESESSGLTPFIRRTTLSTPISNRRHSTPAALWNRSPSQIQPTSGTIQFESVRSQLLEDRVIRRLRRRGLSEEFIKIESEKRHAAQNRTKEFERLKNELAERDVEVLMLREELDLAKQIDGDQSTIITRLQEKERQIAELKTIIQENEPEAERDTEWTLTAQDPFNFHDEDDLMITNYDENFGESLNDEVITTPTRLQTSFPSPPSTIPNTPSRSIFTNSAGIQVSLPVPDHEKAALRSQLEALQSEVSKLTSKLALHDDNQARLSGKLSGFLPTDASHVHSHLDSALDTVLTQLALSQSQALEQTNAFSALGSEITKLGFSPGSSPDKMIADIAAQFRQARLELEYITPGEVEEGFKNERLLDMLVSRIRVLNQRLKESDDKIDQYHDQEVSLRKQLNTRIDAMQDVQGDLTLARTIIGELKQEVSDKEIGNKRLQAALKTYGDEVRSLEKLVEKMDEEKHQTEERMKTKVNEMKNKLQTEILRHDSTTADAEGKTILLTELERRLNAALQAKEDVENQMGMFVAEKDRIIQELKSSRMDREKAHGNSLALRDARISEFRREIDHLNEALAASYSNVLVLGNKIKLLKEKVKSGKKSAQTKIATMQEEVNHVMQAYSESASVQSSPQRSEIKNGHSIGETRPELQPVVKRGRYFDASLARRRSSKGRGRRYDSGLDFLEEEGGGEGGEEGEEEQEEQEEGEEEESVDVDTLMEPAGV